MFNKDLLKDILTVTVEAMPEDEKASLYNIYSDILNEQERELIGFVNYTKNFKNDDYIGDFLDNYINHPDIIAKVFSGYDENKNYYLFDDDLYMFDTFEELAQQKGYNALNEMILDLVHHEFEVEELRNEKLETAFHVYYKIEQEQHKKAMQEKEEQKENELLETISTIIQ